MLEAKSLPISPYGKGGEDTEFFPGYPFKNK